MRGYDDLVTASQEAGVILPDRLRELNGFLEDGGFQIRILNTDNTPHVHVDTTKHQAFIRPSSLHDRVEAFLSVFGEYQHDALGNHENEADAQREIDNVVSQLPEPYRSRYTFRHGP